MRRFYNSQATIRALCGPWITTSTATSLSREGKSFRSLLRVEGLDATGQADLIRSVYAQCETALSEGAAVSATAKEFVSGGYPQVVASRCQGIHEPMS